MAAVSERQSCILLLRPRGLNAVISGVVWPEDQTSHTAFAVFLHTRTNPFTVMRSITFPAGVDRKTAEAFLANANRDWLNDLYRSEPDREAA